MLTITCVDCGNKTKSKSLNRIRCDDCAETERQRRNRSYQEKNKKYHKCATCEASVPEHKTHCGSAIKKGTCMYEHAKRLACESHKKPKPEKTHKRQVRNHRNDPACGSAYF